MLPRSIATYLLAPVPTSPCPGRIRRASDGEVADPPRVASSRLKACDNPYDQFMAGPARSTVRTSPVSKSSSRITPPAPAHPPDGRVPSIARDVPKKQPLGDHIPRTAWRGSATRSSARTSKCARPSRRTTGGRGPLRAAAPRNPPDPPSIGQSIRCPYPPPGSSPRRLPQPGQVAAGDGIEMTSSPASDRSSGSAFVNSTALVIPHTIGATTLVPRHRLESLGAVASVAGARMVSSG